MDSLSKVMIPSMSHEQCDDGFSAEGQSTTSTSSFLPGFEGLPQEVTDIIADNLDLKSILSMCKTSRGVHHAIARAHLEPYRTFIDSAYHYGPSQTCMYPPPDAKYSNEASRAITRYLHEVSPDTPEDVKSEHVAMLTELWERQMNEARRMGSISFHVRDSQTQGRIIQSRMSRNNEMTPKAIKLGSYRTMAPWRFTLPPRVKNLHFATDRPCSEGITRTVIDDVDKIYNENIEISDKIKTTIEFLVKEGSTIKTLSMSTLPNVLDVGYIKNVNLLGHLSGKTLSWDQQSGGLLIPDGIPTDVLEINLRNCECPARIVFNTVTPENETFHLTLPRELTSEAGSDTKYATFDQYITEIARATRLGGLDTEYIITGIERWSDEWIPKEITGVNRANYVERAIKKAMIDICGDSDKEEDEPSVKALTTLEAESRGLTAASQGRFKGLSNRYIPYHSG